MISEQFSDMNKVYLPFMTGDLMKEVYKKRIARKMFNNCYFDYYGKNEKDTYGQGVVSKIELWIDDNQSPIRKVRIVFSEKCAWKNFLETNYNCSDGTAIKYRTSRRQTCIRGL